MKLLVTLLCFLSPVVSAAQQQDTQEPQQGSGKPRMFSAPNSNSCDNIAATMERAQLRLSRLRETQRLAYEAYRTSFERRIEFQRDELDESWERRKQEYAKASQAALAARDLAWLNRIAEDRENALHRHTEIRSAELARLREERNTALARRKAEQLEIYNRKVRQERSRISFLRGYCALQRRAEVYSRIFEAAVEFGGSLTGRLLLGGMGSGAWLAWDISSSSIRDLSGKWGISTQEAAQYFWQTFKEESFIPLHPDARTPETAGNWSGQWEPIPDYPEVDGNN